jgi:heat shock protein HslJ
MTGRQQRWIALLLCTSGALPAQRVLHAADTDSLRYRGEYIYGHEVEIFCPAINSQCYWPSPQTDMAIRRELRSLSAASEAPPYTPVCVVLEGSIDRLTPRTGFAADYDGLMSVTRVFGRCNETAIVTQGDLQHHRWLLERIDGEPVDVDGPMPELDFGERMTVSGSLGCSTFSASTALRGSKLGFSDILTRSDACGPASLEIEQIMFNVISAEPAVSIGEEQQLILNSAGTELQFRLEDWK